MPDTVASPVCGCVSERGRGRAGGECLSVIARGCVWAGECECERECLCLIP